MTICARHYVPIPGGGMATPGELLSDAAAARFSPQQIEHLLRVGAVTVEGETSAVEPEAEPAEPQTTDADIDGTEGIVKPRGRRKKQ